MKKLLLLFSGCVFTSFLFSQTPKYRIISIPVFRNGVQLREPWTGGMNSPQFSAIDLNGDSYKDLFVFDREGDRVQTYLNNGNGTDSSFDYAPQYEELFPSTLTAWALIRDYNRDGIPDVFAHANGGICVYKGSIQWGNLHYDQVSAFLQFAYPPYETHIWTNISDIPVITDVNRDGDMDILAYDIFGGTIDYYENQTVEHAGNLHYVLDSFKYMENTICWGNISQNSLTNSINLNVSCKGGSGGDPGRDSRHSGNSIYNLDEGNDHDVDLLNGNVGYDNLMFLKNGGDSTYANITVWDSLYPMNPGGVLCDVPMVMQTYPAAFGFDVNNDQLEDVLISPNVTSGGRDVKNVMYYQNTGNPSCPYSYKGDSFLIRNTLDFGTDSKPVFYDFNGDGLLDIVVGNYGYFRPFQTYKSTLAIYYNTGTTTQPRFTMRDEDYSGFSSYNLEAVYPAFGDLDGDGKPDLMVGDINGNLQYFKNMGTAISSFPAMTTPMYDSIDVGQYAAPFIYDVNGDGLNDLVIGRFDGHLSYYWNFGTPTVPQFSKDSVNTDFGNVNVCLGSFTQGYSQPFIMKDNAGNLKLFVGSFRGTIFEYDINSANLRSGSFNLIDSNFLGHDVGSKATITIADLNNDGDWEYLTGNSLGGLMLYSDSLWDPSAQTNLIPPLKGDNQLRIYPNPSKDYFVCTVEGPPFINPKTEIFNLLGEKMMPQTIFSDGKITVNTTNLSSGFYIIRIFDEGRIFTGKILIDK